MVTKFDYQHLFKPFGLDKRTRARIVTDENFLFKIEDKKYIYVGDEVFTFETVDDIEEYISESKYNDVKYPFALSNENIYYMLYQKYITIEEFDNSKMFDEYQFLYIKDEELKGDKITVENEGVVEDGYNFLNCNFFDSKQIYM